MSYEEEKQDRKIEQLEAEIERLRAENAGLSKAVIDVQEERDLAQAEFRAYHKAWEEQEASLKYDQEEIERLRAEIAKAKQTLSDSWQLRDEQAARIKELEDALVEERAGFLHYRASCYDPGRRCPYATGCNDCTSWDTCSALNRFHEDARSQLQAEGKIGPDASKPRSWKITDERIEFLRAINDILEDAGFVSEDVMQTIRTVLRAMLEAGQ